MNDFASDVRRILRANGCERVRQDKGDHEIWYSPHSRRKFPVDGIIKSRHTANGIKKQAGIDHHFP